MEDKDLIASIARLEERLKFFMENHVRSMEKIDSLENRIKSLESLVIEARGGVRVAIWVSSILGMAVGALITKALAILIKWS